MLINQYLLTFSTFYCIRLDTREQVGSRMQALGLQKYVQEFRTNDAKGPEILVPQWRNFN